MKILKFYADWCVPCKVLTKTIDKFKELHPEIEIEAINIEEDEATPIKYKVSSVPTLIKLVNGIEEDRKVGAIPLKEFEDFVFNTVE